MSETFSVTHFIESGLILVVSLAWNEAITLAIRSAFPRQSDDALGLIVYAFILTIIVYFLIRFLRRG